MTGDETQARERTQERRTDPTAPQPSGDRFAAELRGFGLPGLIAILVIFAGNLVVVPLSALFVLAWVRWTHTPWRDIGYVCPKSWIGALIGGLAFGIAFKLLMKMIVMPILGAEPINQAYRYLVGNTSALPAMLYMVILGAGFGEETVFRGFVFERLGRLLGSGAAAKVITVVVSAAWFSVAHDAVQGIAGVQQAMIVGLVFGGIFAATGRIWMIMCAHAAFDLTALALIYWDLEYSVAHFIFR